MLPHATGSCERHCECCDKHNPLVFTWVPAGVKPPKGVLMYGPPGTGKTLLARACAAQTSACFLKLAASQLVQMFIGDGAKLVRDAFALGKQKAPAIIFLDELVRAPNHFLPRPMYSTALCTVYPAALH